MRHESSINNRRNFIAKGIQIALVGGIASATLYSCKEKEEGDEKEVSPPEDLMQEHGLLNRILLIYDYCRTQLINKESFDVSMLSNAAGIVRTFVEEYHERQEEEYLFPRVPKR